MNNDTRQQAFPGYEAEQARAKKQECVAKAQEKADEIKTQRVARDKKRAESMPPFLMVRSGMPPD